MINFNGNLISKEQHILTANNRSFKYGDAIFETIKMVDELSIFLEDHYFRLLASMRMLRMEIPMHFTLSFLQEEIAKTARVNKLTDARVRLTVFRRDGGLYSPLNHDISYVIECSPLRSSVKKQYEVDVFKDYFINKDFLASIKSTNRLLNVLAGIYMKENQFDNCVLLNNDKHIAEAINGNLFIVVGNEIKTPALTEGCINGIVRKKIIELVKDDPVHEVLETSISPFELLKADEVFITNAIVGIQPVTSYKKKRFATEIAQKLSDMLSVLV